MTLETMTAEEMIVQITSFLRVTLDKVPEYRGRDFCLAVDGTETLDLGTTCTPDSLKALITKMTEVELNVDFVTILAAVGGEDSERTIN